MDIAVLCTFFCRDYFFLQIFRSAAAWYFVKAGVVHTKYLVKAGAEHPNICRYKSGK